MAFFYDSISDKNLKIIGVDEAGRGCLSGPVYSGAVVFKSHTEELNKLFKDSKVLTSEAREELYELIQETHFYGVGFATAKEVEKINILQATFLSMRRALDDLDQKLKKSQDLNSFNFHVMIDGNQKIPAYNNYPQTTVIKGDKLISEISAASIVAKVARDQYMKEIDLKYPEYEFCKHKGYGTELHREKIKQHGPCPEHRTTFKGVREYLSVKSQ